MFLWKKYCDDLNWTEVILNMV